MKLATLNDGSRDGQLVVVSRDLTMAHYATGVADRLQQVLDDWNFLSPQLQTLSDALNHGHTRYAFAFDPAQCLAPLPRSYGLVLGQAYGKGPAPRQGKAASKPCADPAQLGFSDDLCGPRAPLHCASALQNPDFCAALAVITGDVPQGASPAQALDGVRLLMLANHWVLRQLDGLISVPATSFSPVAVTPDELTARDASVWAQGKLALTLQCQVNGRKVGALDAAHDMDVPMGDLIAQVCQTRRLRAGAIVSSGEVRQRDSSHGFASVAARRAFEATQDGKATAPWLGHGDSVAIDMKGRDGKSMFGRIDQDVHCADAPATRPLPAE